MDEKLQAELAAQKEALEKAQKELEAKQAEIKAKEEEAERIKREAEEQALKHQQTLAANARLSIDKAATKEEIKILEETVKETNKKLETVDSFMASINAEAKRAEQAAKEELIKSQLKNSGFTSESLLVKEFNIDEVKIEEGVIVGFEEKVEQLKKEHPNLYVDGSAGISQPIEVSFGGVTSAVEALQTITQKLEKGTELSDEEVTLAMFGHIK